MSPLFKDIASLPDLPMSWGSGRRTTVITFTASPPVRGTISIIRYGRADLPHRGNVSNSDILAFRFLPQHTPFEKWLVARELAISRRLSHPRILQLVTTTSGPDFGVFVTPFMIRGDIRQYLSVTPAADIDRLNLITDVAEGLNYLHNEALVVHGDLRPGKILVSESGRALITGFAMSNDILASMHHGPETSEWDRMDQPAKPSTYYCPELLGPAPRRTPASDIYAFGTMIFEIMAGRGPIFEFNTLQTMGACPLSGAKAEALWRISSLCRTWEPHIRPHAAAILRELNNIERGTNSGNGAAPRSGNAYAPGVPIPPNLPANLLQRSIPPSMPDPPPISGIPGPSVFPDPAVPDPSTLPPPLVPNLPVSPAASRIIPSHAGSPSVPIAPTAFPAAGTRHPAIPESRIITDNPRFEPRPPPGRIPSSRYPATLTFLYDRVTLRPRDVELWYRGPCSCVWRGTVSIAGREQYVAIKILHAETSLSPAVSGSRRAFDRELRIWQRLRHPNILPLFASNPEACAFVSPFMQEGTLLEYLDKHEGLVDPLRLICDVADGIFYLHKTVGVVHGDVKPANIFVTNDGNAILGDFGLSTTISPGHEVTELGIRSQFTVAYCAPELMADNAVYPSRPRTQRSKTTMTDMYAFGLVLYQAYGGILPKAGPSGNLHFFLQMNDGVFPPKLEPNLRASLFCEEVWAHCVRCWSKDPLERPEIDALLGQLKDLCVSADPPEPVARSPRAVPASPAPESSEGVFPGGLPPVPDPSPAPAHVSSESAALDLPRAADLPASNPTRRLARAKEVCARWIHIAAYLSLIYFVGYWAVSKQ